MPNNLLRQPNFAALVTLVWLLVALALLLQYWTQTAETLFDTDDAMRLAQLRDWLGGRTAGSTCIRRACSRRKATTPTGRA